MFISSLKLDRTRMDKSNVIEKYIGFTQTREYHTMTGMTNSSYKQGYECISSVEQGRQNNILNYSIHINGCIGNQGSGYPWN